MPNNNQREPEDIFAGAEPARKKLPKTSPPEPAKKSGAPAGPLPKNKSSKFWVYLMVVLVIIILAGGIAYAYFSGVIFNKNKNNAANKNVNTANTSVVNESFTIPKIEATNQPLDTDADGLTDEEEKNLGTKIDNPDSDSDGLADRDEVKVYKTNPLVKDTDQDGVSDGDEVKKGDNPNGSGKLLDLNKEINKLENTNQ